MANTIKTINVNNVASEDNTSGATPVITTAPVDNTRFKNNIPIIRNNAPIDTTRGSMNHYNIIQGFRSGASRNFNIGAYEDVLGKNKVNPNIGIEALDELRARNQSGWRLAGHAAAQTVGTIIGDAISGVGLLGNIIGASAKSIFTDAKAVDEFTIDNLTQGVLVDAGNNLSDRVRESLPIYQTKLAQEKGIFNGAFGDATWWASNFPTIGSAVSTLVPQLGALKAISVTGNLLKGVKGVSKLSKLARGVGKGLSNTRTQQAIGALIGMHLDGAMEIAHGYDEQFQKALDLGFDENKAREFAATWASESYKNGLAVNLITNLIEVDALFKATKFAPVNNKKIADRLDAAVEGIAQKGSKFDVNSIPNTSTLGSELFTAGKKLAQYPKMMLQEGIQEMGMDWALKEGEYAADVEIGKPDDKTASDRFLDFISNAKNWDTAFWGAMGGLTMTGATGTGRLVNRLLNGEELRKAETQRADRIIDIITNTATKLSNWNGNLGLNIVEQEVDLPDGTKGKKRVIDTTGMNAMVELTKSLTDSDGYEYVLNYLDKVESLSDEQIMETYGSEGLSVDRVRQNVKDFKAEIKRASKIALDVKGISLNSRFDKIHQSNAFVNRYVKDYLERQKQSVEIAIAEIQNHDRKQFNELQQQLELIDGSITKLNQTLEDLNNKRANQQTLVSEKEKTFNAEKYDSVIKTNDDKKKSLVETKIRLKEEISQIEDRIKSLEETIKRQAAEARQNPSKRKDLNQAISASKSEIIKLKNKRNHLNDIIAKNDITRDRLTAENNFILSDKKYQESIIASLKKDLQSTEDSIAFIQNELNTSWENKKDKKGLYDNILEERKKLKDKRYNKDLDNLRSLLTSIEVTLIDYENNIANEDVRMKEEDNQMRESFEALNKIIDKEEKDKENKEAVIDETENKISENVDSRTTENQQINDSVIVHKDDTSTPKSIEIGSDIYNIDDEMMIENKAVKLTNFVSLPEDKIGIEVKYTKTNETKIYPVNILTNNTKAGLGYKLVRKPLTINERNVIDLIKSIETIKNRLRTEYIGNSNYNGAIDYILKELNDKDSDLFKIFNTHVLDKSLINNQLELHGIILEIIGNITKEYNKSNNNEINNFKTILGVFHKRVIDNRTKLNLYDWINQFWNNSIPGLTSNERANIESKIRNFITVFTNQLSEIGFIEDKGRFILLPSTEAKSIQKTFIQYQVLLDNLINEIKSQYSVENYPELTFNLFKFKTSILEKIQTDLKERFNENIKFYFAKIESIIKAIDKKLKDKSNPNHDEFKSANTIAYKQSLDKLIESVNSLRVLYDSGATVTDSNMFNDFIETFKEYETIRDEYFKKSSGDVINTFNTIDELVTKSIIPAFVNHFNIASLVVIDSIILNEDSLIHDFLSINTNNVSNIDLNTNDVKDLISSDFKNIIYTFDKLLYRLRNLNKYDENHKFTFEDLLVELQQIENGTDYIESNLDAIWFVWDVLVNNDRAISYKNVLDKNKSKFNETEQNEIDNLITSLDSIITGFHRYNNEFREKYVNKTDHTLKDKFLRDFKKNHPAPTEFYRTRRDGIRRLHANVYNVFNNEEYFDKENSKFKVDEININGTTLTVEEYIRLTKSFKPGDNILVRFSETDSNLIEFVYDFEGKAIIIDRFSHTISNEYEGFKLSTITASGKNMYNSVFGTSNDLSQQVYNFIEAIGKDRIFKEIIKYYKAYKSISNVEKRNAELTTILQNANDNLGGDYNIGELLSNIVDEEGSNVDNDLSKINHDKVFAFIKTIFYNIDEKSISDLKYNKTFITRQFWNLNKKLANDHYNTYRLYEILKSSENKETAILISDITKTSLKYPSNVKYRENVNNTVQKDTTLNGKPAVNIIQYQAEKEPTSLTENSTEEISPEIAAAIKTDKQSFIYALIKGNSGSEGFTLIPLHHGNLSNSIDSEFSKFATNITSDIIYKFITDYLLTNSENANSQKYNELLATLSDLVVSEFNNKNTNARRTDFFNTGNIFTERDGSFSKSINFLITEKNSRFKNKVGQSWEINFKMRYDRNGNLKEIIAYKYKVVNRNGVTIAVGDNVPLISKETSGISISNKVKYKNDKSINHQYNIIDASSEDAMFAFKEYLTDIVKSMQRSVNTALFGEDNTELAYGKKEYINGKLTTIPVNPNSKYSIKRLLEYAKDNDIEIPQGITEEYDSIQDYLLETGALISPIQSIRDSKNKTVTNYNYSDNNPALFFKLKESEQETVVKNPKVEESKSEEIKVEESQTKLDVTSMKTILSEANNFEKDSSNWYSNYTKNNKNNKIKILKELGVIEDSTPEDIIDAYIDLYDKIYDNLKGVTLEIKNLKNKRINGAYQPSKNNIVINTQRLNIAGITLTHESIHALFKNNKTLKDNVIENLKKDYNIEDFINTILNEDYDSFINKYSTENVKLTNNEYDLLKTYIKEYNKEYSKRGRTNEFIINGIIEELIANSLTNNDLKGISNKVIIDKSATQTKSIWRTIWETILKALGINQGSLTDIIIESFAKTEPVIESTNIAVEQVEEQKETTVEKPNIFEDTLDLEDIFDDNLSINVEESVTAGRGEGYAPTLETFEDFNETILPNESKSLYSQRELLESFKSIYRDKNGNKLC